MKIARARLTPLRLRLREPLDTGTGRIALRRGALLELFGDAGRVGRGEAAPLADFGGESPESARGALEEVARALLGADLDAGLRLLDAGDGLAGRPAARAALDTALCELAARNAGVPLCDWLAAWAHGEGLRASPEQTREHVGVNLLVRARARAAAAREAARARACGVRTLKLKLAGDTESERARAAAVREYAGAQMRLRLDANGRYTESEALRVIAALSDCGIELVEQPVAAVDLDALARVRAATPVAIAADEAAATPAGAARVLARGAADVLIVKPSVAGGPRAALRIAAAARARGIGVIVTTALDGAVGAAAALHVAAVLPDPLPDCGLASGGLFERDLAPPPVPVGGALPVPRAPGLGLDPDGDALRALADGPALEVAA